MAENNRCTDCNQTVRPRQEGIQYDQCDGWTHRKCNKVQMCADHSGLASSGVIRQSQNYTWFTSDSIGKGATAIVYKGRKKNTGDVYAIKVFQEYLGAEYSSSRYRELELLQTIKHENVIQFIAVEREALSNATVVVMEFCEGGSLYSMLDTPKYAYGLPESEFLLVIHHIASGMRYLREQDIVHRDIKPGNIMRFIQEDSSSLYKLTDFGAARYLESEENFTSLYGTEEYLHPGIFKKAVLHQPTSQTFDARVDLWSLGVTIYHIATGQLPFQPYGGRNNSHTMYKIITEKASGVISGLQPFEGGPITWSKQLPQTCFLSICLQSMLVPILAGLMEADERKMLSYSTFFIEVDSIVKKKTLTIFNFIMCVNMILYLDPDTTYTKLQEKIALETEIPAAEQILLINSYPLDVIVSPLDAIKTYPKYVLNGQLFLFPREGRDQLQLKFPDLPTYPARNMHMTLEKDVRLAQLYCNNTYLIKAHTETAMKCQQLLYDSVCSFRMYVKRFTKHTEEYMSSMKRLMEETSSRIDSFFSILKIIVNLLNHVSLQFQLSRNEEFQHSLESLKNQSEDRSVHDVLRRAMNRVSEVKNYMDLLTDKLGEYEKTAASTTSVGCEKDRNCYDRVERYCDIVTEIWQVYKQHKNQRMLTEPDRQVHQWERERLGETSMQAVDQLQNQCRQKLWEAYNVYFKQSITLGKSISRLQKVDKNIQSVMDCQQLLSSKMKELEEKSKTFMNNIYTIIVAPGFMTSRTEMIPINQLSKTLGVPSGADSGYSTRSSSQSSSSSVNPVIITQELPRLVSQIQDTLEIVKTDTELLQRFQLETEKSETELVTEEKHPS